MPLISGQSLGPYQIVAPLGAGGMGEVYRARDVRLDRVVAIKVLPEALAHDPERLLRFEREARLLALLNHPNIAAIYGFEPYQLDSRTTYLLVLEFVDGPTLADRLKTGPLPVDDALDIGKQIAEALEVAHEKGIIHRDLKPANVKLTPDGKVKVLDFGLAKALSDENSASNIVDSPTITANYTRPGVVLGTAPYMSPEQARGKPLDKRTDIWSFGCVLYECLSGTRLFEGESSSDIIARILERDPDFGTLPPRTPPRIRELLRQTLEKNSKRRLRDIGDAVIALDSAVLNREWSTTAVTSAALPSRGIWRRVATAGALALVLLAAGYVGRKTGTATPPPTRPSLTTHFTKLTDLAGVEYMPTLSPDGKTVAYVAKDGDDLDIFSLRVGGLNPINLTKDCPKDDTQPAFSPDGSRIAFRSERDGGGLFVMEATGESPRRLTDSGFNPAWSADGRLVVFATECVDGPFSRSATSPIWTIDVATGEKKKITDGDAVQPSMSPNGRRVAYWSVWKQGGQRDLYTIPVSGGKPVALTDDPATDWNPIWSPDGRFIYFCSDRGGSMNIWRVAVDENTGRRSGDYEPVTAGVTQCAHLSISADGRRIAFTSSVGSMNVEKVVLDAKSASIQGEPIPVSRGSGGLMGHSASPDGEWIACQPSGVQEDVILLRKDGRERRQLTNDRYKDRGPVWSPEGRPIAFYSDRSGKYEIWAVNPDGSNLTQLSRTSKSSTTAPRWSPDGKRLLFLADKDMLVIDPSKGWADQTPQVVPATDGQGHDFSPDSWSPDGTSIAGTLSDGNGPSAVAIYSLEKKKAESIGLDGVFAVWLPDGRHLLFAKDADLFVCDSTGKNSRKLLSIAPDSFGTQAPFVSSDGTAIYYTRSKTESDVWLLETE